MTAALEGAGGRDHEQIERVEWADVVLPDSVAADLRALLDLMRPGQTSIRFLSIGIAATAIDPCMRSLAI